MLSSKPPYPPPNTRLCAHNGCENEGLHRAPKNTGEPREFVWFCLEHVRDYNAKWNYFAGRSNEEVEREIRRASLWERPTWPFGKGPLTQKTQPAKAKRTQASEIPASVRCALAGLDLEPPVSLSLIKTRYRHLAKSLHPDTSDGSPENIEKFHTLQQAFATLRKYYAKKPAHKNTAEEW